MHLRSKHLIICSLALGTVGVVSSALAATEPAKEKISAQERYENLGLFNKVLYFIEQNYVEDVKDKDLIQGAIKGMLETLDPHSSFLTAEIFKDMKIDTAGKFGGLGIEVGKKDSIMTVISPIEDTPAYRAGIKSGDRILKINGESTKGLSLEEAVGKMRGKTGSDIRLTIWREGFEKTKDFVLRREVVRIKAVKHEVLEPNYLYLRLTNFSESASHDLKKIMDDYENNHGPLRGVIFDLRNNPGGLLDQAVNVSSLFIDDGVVVSTRGRNKEAQEVKYAKKGMARTYMPMAVLVNGASASASEIVAGALQDHKRAAIMGQPTFGKGSVQTIVELAPEMGLKLTIARYYTPSGRSIQLKGIQPDLVLDDYDQKILEEATRKQDLVHERDLKRRMNNDTDDKDKDNEYKMEELIEASHSEQEKDDKQAKKAEKKEDVRPFVAKDDYQVRQALNYIKSYQTFRAMKWGVPGVPTLPTASEGTETAKAGVKESK